MEQLSFEGRKVIVSAWIMLHDWLKKTNTIFSYNPKQTKTNYTHSHRFSRTFRQLHVISLSFVHWIACVLCY